MLSGRPIIPISWVEVRGNVDSSGLPNGESTLDRNSNGVSVENSEKLEEGPSGKLPIEVIQEDGFVSFVSIEPVARGGGDGGAIGLIIVEMSGFSTAGGTKEECNFRRSIRLLDICTMEVSKSSMEFNP